MEDIEKDFIFNMDFTNKTFWQKIRMGQLIQEGAFSYKKNGTTLLKKLYGKNYYWRYVYFTITKYFNAIYKLTSFYFKN